ncbi:hypothetical protein ACN9MN_07035 [Chryseobacterium sp. S-02]|uniref:hypothetical protein n=1 Tax=Chryseobacterium sp. S-02 TaxID=3404064 RepID=UPI003CED80D0
MKKFISWVSAIVVLVSMLSCREAEELSTIPDEMQNHSTNAKVQKDSVSIQSQDGVSNGAFDGAEGDPPPKKDEIKW